jgi:hypothetical protein
VFGSALSSSLYRGRHRRRDFAVVGKLRKRVAKSLASTAVTFAVEKHCPREQRREIQRGQCKRPLDGSDRSLNIAGSPAKRAELRPKLNCRRAFLNGLLERLQGGLKIARGSCAVRLFLKINCFRHAPTVPRRSAKANDLQENGGPLSRPAAILLLRGDLEVDREAGEQIPAERIVHLRIGVAVAEAGRNNLLASDRRVAVEDIVHAHAQV